jgi:hypothetical protein
MAKRELHGKAVEMRRQGMSYSQIKQLLGVSKGTLFRRPYIKESKRSGLTYKQQFTHGTCNILCHRRDLGEYVHAGIASLQDSFIAGSQQV